ncbi:MAG: Flp family type IVb pilin [Planctomycetota bacterium]|jgi:Flp pilus assembly pilin Flp
MKAIDKIKKAAKRGQGMTEYIIIIAVVAVLSIAVIMKYGNQIREMFWASGEELSGGDGTIEGQMGTKDEEMKTGVRDL